jgi:glycosyltransferase involved in cell wall biosynthesis
MINFSIVVITRNEEKTLPRLLKSLEEFKERGGEVCVLDTGSTDKTVEVAREWGCKIKEVGDKFVKIVDEQFAKKVNEKFGEDGRDIIKAGDKSFHFADARNEAAEMSSNRMVATPDADEIYTVLDLDKTIDYVDKNDQLEFNFVFAHDEKGNPVIKFIQCKMYDKIKMKWVGRIHEVISPVLQGQPIRKDMLPEDVYKIEHYQNHGTNRGQYLVGLAIDCYENPEKDRNSHYFARELMYCGYYKSAIKEFKRHISMNGWKAERSQSMIYVGNCYLYLGDEIEALGWYHKAYIFYPERREGLIKLGEHFFKKQDWDKTIMYLEGSLKIKRSGFYSDNVKYYEDLPHWMLYIAYWWSGEKDKSKYHYTKALEFDPENPKYINDGKFYKES